jgi:thymidylate synthase (FAD)
VSRVLPEDARVDNPPVSASGDVECDPEATPARALAIVRSPEVRLVARQEFLDDPEIVWTTDTQVAGEKLVEYAGRHCYMSFGKGRKTNQEYIRHLLEMGHGSVLEHAVYTMRMWGVSRTCTHELIRHRAGFAYSQLSQRYVDESEGRFVEPDDVASDPERHALWVAAVEPTRAAYRTLSQKIYDALDHVPEKTLRRKLARQAARAVLPNATETRIVVTANARAWRHFIEMRASEGAESEIRKLAVACLKILQVESPNLFGDYTLRRLPDGSEVAETPFRKV